jgi:hypothetical protein
MRYFIGFLITIGLIIILILLLFGGGSPKKPTTPKSLASYASTEAEVRLTIDGQINADQDHEQVRITVNKNDTTFEEIQGYQDTVVNSQSYANNEDAYSNFLYALGHAGFTRGDNSKALANEKGYCPLGERYIFELVDNGKDIQRYWGTSCGKPRTYLGSLNLTLTLFQLQIPDYQTLTENLSL